MYGILNINKPAACTSRDVVNAIQRQARKLKIGHAGTLDPLATGVLVVCVGQATRLVPYLHELPKTYVGTFLLGRRSPSDDTDTEVEIVPDAPTVTTEQLRRVLPQFVGRITQRPPAYSAVKVEGKRAYREARKGKSVEVPEREVEVTRVELIEHQGDMFTLEIDCGTGTYVRSIGRDIAAACGTSAVMSSLCRTRVGDFRVEASLSPESIQRRTLEQHLLSPLLALVDRPVVTVTDEAETRVSHGNDAVLEDGVPKESGEVAICNAAGELLAIGDYHSPIKKVVPRIVLLPADDSRSKSKS